MGVTLADEAKGLPPPRIVNRNSVWLGFCGWCTAMLHNTLHQRPPLKSGVHRQMLLATIGWYMGYYLTKLENYNYARVDRDMKEYMRLFPDRFQAKEKKTFAEILEDFHTIR